MKSKKFSKQENEVLDCLVKGMKNREISTELDINEKTVSTYVNRIKIKSNADKNDNVFVVVLKAMRSGMMSDKSVKLIKGYGF